MPSTSPYPVGTPVTDPRLLRARRLEIDVALEVVAPDGVGDAGHVVLLGEQRSGRTSIVLEVMRRAAEERDRLVVWLRGAEQPHEERTLVRQLLVSTVESLADISHDFPDWYSAWRDRVYLLSREPASPRDRLSSALVLAADTDATIDRSVLERDLRLLVELANTAGRKSIVVCIDDAASLMEDVHLVERLLSVFDAVGGYGLLAVGRIETAHHFIEAASPCLERFTPVIVGPFHGTRQVLTSLRAPLDDAERAWLKPGDADFARDVLRLTGGNPYELMLVGRYLWLTCELGDQDHYALTPRVLDLIVPHLALLAAGGDALRDGAEAIERLDDEHMRHAVELVAMERLTIRQIAVARLLRVDSRDSDRVDPAILEASIDEEASRVLGDLKALEDAGIVQLHSDQERFNVVGGRAVSVLLKYKARARIGAEVTGQPFELGYLLTVGRALARDAMSRTLEAFGTSDSLGFGVVMSRDGPGARSPRPVLRSLNNATGLPRLAQSELGLVVWSAATNDRLLELLTEDDASIALICTAIGHDSEQLEYVELWDAPGHRTTEELARAWSETTEAQPRWSTLVEAADLKWIGVEFALVAGRRAREVIIVSQPDAAVWAVTSLFEEWYDKRDSSGLAKARRLADEAVATLRATGLSDRELGGEISAMLSRAGFLHSLDDEAIDVARAALDEALRLGPADGWITKWNLANVAARAGEVTLAISQLEGLVQELPPGARAFALFYVPGRAAADCLVSVAGDAVRSLCELQRALLLALDGGSEGLSELVAEDLEADDEGLRLAARMVESWLSEGAGQ